MVRLGQNLDKHAVVSVISRRSNKNAAAGERRFNYHLLNGVEVFYGAYSLQQVRFYVPMTDGRMPEWSKGLV